MLSLSVLVVVGATLIVAVILWFRHPYYSPAQRICYGYGYLFARLLWRTQIVGQLDLRGNDGVIIVCNHRSPYDPAFVQLAANRVVHWMVAKEYCRHPSLAWFFRIVQSIPVSRGGVDTAATKTAIRYLQNGGMVGLFPEGRLNFTDETLLPGRPGAALIAIKSGARVVPCYVKGSPASSSILRTMFTPARVKLIVGQPINIADFCDRGQDRAKDRRVLEDLTRLFLKEIAKLAGHDDFEPKLAGRNWKPS